MGRMHSKGKGLSRSSLPYKRSPASWVKTTEAEVIFCGSAAIVEMESACELVLCGQEIRLELPA